MPALSFQKRFAPLVESWQKRQSIRAEGKRHYYPGCTLYLYVGQRTKGCRKLGEATCTEVLPIVISTDGVWLDGRILMGPELDAFAKADGFADTADFKAFFQQEHDYYSHPFYGRVIKW